MTSRWHPVGFVRLELLLALALFVLVLQLLS
jgi:hypothetical protein